ncbi:MAG TPA: ATP-dependent Clp protease proteolytic subunit [Acidobacteriota bacterium]|jgi:ATP-dependent protease ClpP protease subunit|nr:ATP-dependent Clp protease proteolytic subunit [Acidobacteriota bacterium]
MFTALWRALVRYIAGMLPGQPVPSTPKRVYISFSAEIIAHTTESLIAACSNCVNQGVKEIYILLSTPGGNVMHGMNLYNVLRALPVELTMHNVGNVDSIGNAVFLAGAHRYACAHSTFMFHGVGMDVPQAARLEEKSLKEALGNILADQKRIGSVIQDRTKLSQADIEGLFLQAQTKDAAFAASCGIVDKVCDVQIPAGSTVLSLVFQR